MTITILLGMYYIRQRTDGHEEIVSEVFNVLRTFLVMVSNIHDGQHVEKGQLWVIFVLIYQISKSETAKY